MPAPSNAPLGRPAASTTQFQSYHEMPAPQTPQENCVAYDGSLIPIPGRDVMVQAWYQGGISVFDWTDAAHPQEIAFIDHGPVGSTTMASAGLWSIYWYNGVVLDGDAGGAGDAANVRTLAGAVSDLAAASR